MNAQGHSSPTKILNEQLIDRLFVRLNSIYGHLWASRFQTVDMVKAAKAEWAKSLGKYDPSEIGAGIERCIRQHDKPPSLPQFIRLCFSEPKDHKALPAPKTNPDVVRNHLKNIKQNLYAPKNKHQS